MDEIQKYKGKLEIANKKVRILEDMIETHTRHLYTANETLKKQKKELENYAKLVSHDLREPVLTIQGFSELLIKNGSIDETNSQYFKFIHQSSERLLSIIDEILDYTKISKEISMESVATAELIQHISSDIDHLIQKSGTTLIINDLPTVIGAKPMLYSLFQNLITNAIKFVPQQRQPIIEISGRNEGKNHQFTIKDNGIGIAKENVDEIFTMYKRVNNDDFKGSGIGLGHCKKIIELHHGDIWVESVPDVGSTFYFTIPHAPA